ncbi:hypothetical protein AgCh_001483 [Apium graveolens]
MDDDVSSNIEGQEEEEEEEEASSYAYWVRKELKDSKDDAPLRVPEPGPEPREVVVMKEEERVDEEVVVEEDEVRKDENNKEDRGMVFL